MFFAAKTGDIEMLKWLHQIGFPLTEELCDAAMRGPIIHYNDGEYSCCFHALKWLHEKGCPCNIFNCPLCDVIV